MTARGCPGATHWLLGGGTGVTSTLGQGRPTTARQLPHATRRPRRAEDSHGQEMTHKDRKEERGEGVESPFYRVLGYGFSQLRKIYRERELFFQSVGGCFPTSIPFMAVYRKRR